MPVHILEVFLCLTSMSSSAISLLPLDYLQASPVRGQLEPHDEASTKPGWRFLQCTDTPNELKVSPFPTRQIHIPHIPFFFQGAASPTHCPVLCHSLKGRAQRTCKETRCFLGTHSRHSSSQGSHDQEMSTPRSCLLC